MVALRQNTAKSHTEALQSLTRINNSHRTQGTEHGAQITEDSPVLRERMRVSLKLKKSCFLFVNTTPWLWKKKTKKTAGFLTIITVLLDSSKTTEYVIESGTFK